MSRAEQQARGLSLRQLTLIFFAAVGLCAIFFALGFLVGAHRQSSSATPVVEQVVPPSDVPPPVNAPLRGSLTGGVTPASPVRTQSSTVIEQNLPGPQAGTRPAAAVSTPGSAHAAALTPGKQRVMIQVAALRTQRDAQSLLGVLKSHGYRAVLLTPQETRAQDHLYRVQIGPFPSRAEAVQSLHKLGSQGFRAFIKE